MIHFTLRSLGIFATGETNETLKRESREQRETRERERERERETEAAAEEGMYGERLGSMLAWLPLEPLRCACCVC